MTGVCVCVRVRISQSSRLQCCGHADKTHAVLCLGSDSEKEECVSMKEGEREKHNEQNLTNIVFLFQLVRYCMFFIS